MTDYKYTEYFEKEVLRKRSYIRKEWCIRVPEVQEAVGESNTIILRQSLHLNRLLQFLSGILKMTQSKFQQ